MRRALRFLLDTVEEVGKVTVESLIEGLRMAPRQPGKPPMNNSTHSAPKCIETVLRVHRLAA